MKMKTALPLALVIALPVTALGRIKPLWTYQRMQEQADLVVIGKPVSSTATTEKAVLPNISPNVPVVGMETEFAVRVVMKGEAAVQRIAFHHYSLANVEDGRVRGAPNLVSFDPKQHQCYLLFLKKEADGRFAPVTGQTDPGDACVIKLESNAQ
jgi:hypothetical protein